MIDGLLADFLGRVADGAARVIGVALVGTSRRGGPGSGRARSRPVIVSADEMTARARAYEKWAASRDLEVVRGGRTDAHGAHFRGTHCGRTIELATGVGEYGPPTSPELLVWTDAIATERAVLIADDVPPEQAPPATSWARELRAVLEVDGVCDVGVTDRFVRVRFRAFAPPRVLGTGWDALESALTNIANAEDPGAPYRGGRAKLRAR